MSVSHFRESLLRFAEVKLDDFLKIYQVNTLQKDLGCVNVKLF